jgi:DNA-binding CsgD family transcriptional regulator
MPTTIDRKEELVRTLGRLGIDPLDLVTSIPDTIAVLDGERRVVALVGDWPDESSQEHDDVLGKTLREMFGRQAAAVHEAAHVRAWQGERVTYEWTGRKGRDAVRWSTTACPLRGRASDVAGVMLVTRNVSPVRRGDETWRLLELEHGIQRLAGALQNYRKARPLELRDSPLQLLSARERQVLDALGRGYRPRSIAAQLHVSPETVRNHLKAMFKKTGTHSQEELIALLRASGSL